MKKITNLILKFVAIITFISCNDVKEECSSKIEGFRSDSSVCYISPIFYYHGKCVQKLKFKGSYDEYGHSFLLADTLIISMNNNIITIQSKAEETLKSNKTIELSAKNIFYDTRSKDSIYKLELDAIINGYKNKNIFLVILINKNRTIEGFYIHDKSEYIVKTYSKSMIRSIKGNIYSKIDTSNVLIEARKP